MRKILHKSKLLIVAFAVLSLGGCAMFSTSPTLTLKMHLDNNSNNSQILTVLAAPMSEQSFINTDYEKALSLVGKSSSHTVTLTPDNFADGDYLYKVPVNKHQGMGVFVFYTNVVSNTQWKQYIPEAYGKKYEVTIGKDSLSNFSA
ncbi:MULTISPECIES: hypothetical protein [Cysteiniphilum]|uniref:hypothetical protein n=1 Tax=Cysteiniphilum TaxID=2056696 RepID=UPI00177B7E41|nr:MULTISPECIES: hypothetical protein [Cysteiniphilum]